MVALTPGSTAPTLRELEDARIAERKTGAAEHPVVREVLQRFKGARIVAVRGPQAPPAPEEAPPPPTDDDVSYSDADPFDDDL
jgi:DNA polymerase-3 subunit gamma/tau